MCRCSNVPQKLLPVVRRAFRSDCSPHLTPDRLSREEIYLAFAELWASRSVCLRLQVGAVITDAKMRRVLAIGYNGPARGLPHDRCRNVEGDCGCIHAEANAVSQADSEIPNKILFVTTMPCRMCAQFIIQNNITAVHALGAYRDTVGLDLLSDCGIPVYQWIPKMLTRSEAPTD